MRVSETAVDVPQIETICPLSPIQEEILLHSRSSKPGTCIRQAWWSFAEGIDFAVWQQAWQTLVGRHAILRTAFAWEKLRRPVQIVTCESELQWRHWDLSRLDRSLQVEKLHAVLQSDRKTGFDWRRPPLMRCGIIEMTPPCSICFWSYHAIVLDLESWSRLLTEAFQLYERIQRNQPCSRIQARPYHDYAIWACKRSAAEDEEFWRATLKGFDTPSLWQPTTARAEGATGPKFCKEARLVPSLAAVVRDFLRTHGLRLQTLVQGAWGVALARKLGRNDVLFGTRVSVRSDDKPGIESVIGPFGNTVPVRIRLQSDVTIVEYLQNLQGQQDVAASRHHVSLSLIRQWSEVGHVVPLFDSVVLTDPLPKFPEIGISGFPTNAYAMDEDDIPLKLMIREDPDIELAALWSGTRLQEQESISQAINEMVSVLECFSTSGSEDVLGLLIPQRRNVTLGKRNGMHHHPLLAQEGRCAAGAVMIGTDPQGARLSRTLETGKRDRESAIPRVAPHRELPLSFAQQRLWFLNHLSPGDPAYNITSILRLRGKLDRRVLQRTIHTIVRRHEILRTSFHAENGVPSQSVSEQAEFSLPVLKPESRDESERELVAMRMAREEAAKPFDLSSPHPFRTTLVQLGPENHWLILTMHHIVSDGWSSGLMTKEFSLLYQALSQGKPSPLSELPIQYGDFAVWQQSWLNAQRLEEGLAYWRNQLNGATVLQLPQDKPALSKQEPGSPIYVHLDSAASGRLRAFAVAEGATLFMALLAVFKIVLHAFTWQEDIMVGTDVANRMRPELEPLIGFFANQLVLRTNLSGNPTFREVVKRVRTTTLNAYRHEDVPFDKLVQELSPPERPGASPFFLVKFVLQNFPNASLEIPGLKCEIKTLENPSAKFPILLTITETGPHARLACLEFDSTMFYRSTAERLMRQFERALDELSNQPEMLLRSIAETLRSAEMDEHPWLGTLDSHRRTRSALSRPKAFSEGRGRS